MIKKYIIVRWILTILILISVFFESGICTSLSISLLCIGRELDDYINRKRFKNE